MLRSVVSKGLRLADDVFIALSPDARRPAAALVGVLFHSLYASREQLCNGSLAPNQGVTVDDFRNFVEAALEAGYHVVSPEQVDAGLEPGRNYLAITFDDGYYNNTLALDVLEEFQVPATFFVSSHHVLQNKAFWWDAFSRQLTRTGATHSARKAKINALKTLTNDGIEAVLRERFGNAVLQPHSDLDRPFTAPELRDFARNKWVRLGNHTRDHEILTNCLPSEMASQIQDCQRELAAICGYAPVAIAYPNGNCSPAAVEAAAAAGLRVGFTVRPTRNAVPLATEYSRMTLGRFMFWGGQDARLQWRKFSSSFVPSNALRTLISGY